ncbi:hypothetical protein CBR_g46621 [Chara braunii]|uniref:DUF659 domain-containing protein n=1 Tax=Chara braunii TaxID=69332 RepID=A0A388M0W8_CHABU|nr:hypothetical protein CBR_g46621 [Chara braunii]|eukprot:GBG88132.1 hypothetical protein CBR_g46621 [Chara braunii]
MSSSCGPSNSNDAGCSEAGGGSKGKGERKPKGKVKVSHEKPPFDPASNSKQMELEKIKPAYRWVLRRQEAEPKGYANCWHKCKSCGRVWTASYTRVVEHFTAKREPCAKRTGEILHILASKGAKIDCPITRRMIQLYRLENNIADGADPQPVLEHVHKDNLAKFMLPPTAPGREAVGESRDGLGMVTDDGHVRRERAEDPSGSESATQRPSANLKQASIRRWTENSSQQRLDIAWGFHLYEHGTPFNYVTGEKTQELHKLYLELGEKKQRVKMPNRMQMATVVLDVAYDQTREAMRPVMETWDITGCTLITDGCTDRKFRPIMNFIIVGGAGAVLLKVVDMLKRKKMAIPLAKLWEGVIREIGVHRVNALCTDNAEVNKHAARLLRRRTDRSISRIPWVPCAAHCLNLLLKGISDEPWMYDLYKRGKTIVKCIRNHHKTAQLFLDCSEMERTRTLIMPTEVRFASVYMMLERLLDRKKVLKAMMVGGWLDVKWASRKKRTTANTVSMTVRSDDWWREVEAAVNVMSPVYDLLRKMDKSGTAPYSLWGFEEALIKKMTSIPSLTPARRESIAKKVGRRCKMMRQPVHAANFLFNPSKRDPRWMNGPKSLLLQNAMIFLLSQCEDGATWGCKEHLDLWDDLKTFHKEPQGNSSLPLEKQDSFWTDFAKFDSNLDKRTASDCWGCHGKSHEKLQRIAARVTAMWSTATPCEHNWSTLDLIHEKRNQLSSEEEEGGGFIDMWADFFGADAPPPIADPDILPDDMQPTADEVARRDRLRKAPHGRIPKVGRLDDSSASDSSDDGEDLVWKGKGKKSKEESLAAPAYAKGEALVEAEEYGEDEEEEDRDEDMDFGLRSDVAAPANAKGKALVEAEEYGEDEEEEEDRDEDMHFRLRSDVEPDDDFDDDDDEDADALTMRPETGHFDSDLEFLVPRNRDRELPAHDNDEADRAMAQALAKRDRVMVNQRIEEDAARRVAVPRRTERKERRKSGADQEGEDAGQQSELRPLWPTANTLKRQRQQVHVETTQQRTCPTHTFIQPNRWRKKTRTAVMKGAGQMWLLSTKGDQMQALQPPLPLCLLNSPSRTSHR